MAMHTPQKAKKPSKVTEVESRSQVLPGQVVTDQKMGPFEHPKLK